MPLASSLSELTHYSFLHWSSLIFIFFPAEKNVLPLKCVYRHHSDSSPYCWNGQTATNRFLEFFKLSAINWDMITTQKHAVNHNFFVLEVLNNTYPFQLPPWNQTYMVVYSVYFMFTVDEEQERIKLQQLACPTMFHKSSPGVWCKGIICNDMV